MDQYDELLKTIEGAEMTREVLRFSKLRKGECNGQQGYVVSRFQLTTVMEEMAKIEDMPRNDELNLTARAHELYVKWGNVGNKADEPKTNGAEPDAKSDSKEGDKAEEKTEDKAEDKAEEKADDKPVEEKAEAAAEPAAAEEVEVEFEAEA